MSEPTDLLRKYEARKTRRPEFPLRSGFEVRVHTTLTEGEKTRTQVFEGLVTAITGAGLGKTFTVRRVAANVGVERTFPIHSPLVTNVEIVRATKVRRARLTYLRKTEVRKRSKEDASLMRKVEAEREAVRRAKEEAEQKAHEERAAAERAAKEATDKKAEEGGVKVETSDEKDPAA